MEAPQTAAEMTGQRRMMITTDSKICRDMEPRPMIAVVIAVHYTYENSLRGVRKYSTHKKIIEVIFFVFCALKYK